MSKYGLVYFNDNKSDVIIKASSIGEIDKFTSKFSGYDDMSDYCKIPFNSKIYLFKDYINDPKEMDIVFKSDNIDINFIIDKYYRFLANNRKLINESPIRYVKIGVDINSGINDQDLLKAIHAYFKNDPYKKLRDIYFYMVNKGYVIRDIETKRNDESVEESNDEYLEKLLSDDNTEEIFQLYDLDDMDEETILRVSSSSYKGKR